MTGLGEVRCGTCGETFLPLNEVDLLHLEHADGTPCEGSAIQPPHLNIAVRPVAYVLYPSGLADSDPSLVDLFTVTVEATGHGDDPWQVRHGVDGERYLSVTGEWDYIGRHRNEAEWKAAHQWPDSWFAQEAARKALGTLAVAGLTAAEVIARRAVDTWSSVSRQHRIDTGRYLTVAETAEEASP